MCYNTPITMLILIYNNGDKNGTTCISDETIATNMLLILTHKVITQTKMCITY